MKTSNPITESVPYHMTFRSQFISASSRQSVLSMIRDASRSDSSWENFDSDSLPEYFTDGIKALRAHIEKLSDLSTPRRTEEDKNLWFMVESLIQARHLIEEMRAAKGSNNHPKV